MAEFFAMGGYGFYVWTSYGVALVFMLVEVYALIRKKQSLMRRLTRMIKLKREEES